MLHLRQICLILVTLTLSPTVYMLLRSLLHPHYHQLCPFYQHIWLEWQPPPSSLSPRLVPLVKCQHHGPSCSLSIWELILLSSLFPEAHVPPIRDSYWFHLPLSLSRLCFVPSCHLWFVLWQLDYCYFPILFCFLPRVSQNMKPMALLRCHFKCLSFKDNWISP